MSKVCSISCNTVTFFWSFRGSYICTYSLISCFFLEYCRSIFDIRGKRQTQKESKLQQNPQHLTIWLAHYRCQYCFGLLESSPPLLTCFFWSLEEPLPLHVSDYLCTSIYSMIHYIDTLYIYIYIHLYVYIPISCWSVSMFGWNPKTCWSVESASRDFVPKSLDKFSWLHLVGGLEHCWIMTFHILGMSSSQLTKSYFSEG